MQPRAGRWYPAATSMDLASLFADLLIITCGTLAGVAMGSSLPVAFLAACVGFCGGSLVARLIRGRAAK